MKSVSILLLAGTLAALPVAAEDLVGVFNTALTVDPTFQQADFTHRGARETRVQAILNMVPIDASANKNWYGVQGGPTVSQPAVATLGLNVNLLSWNSWINLKSANAQTAQADANYVAAQQSLVSRVTSAYFAVLAAKDTLASQDSALASAARQLEQAQRRFEVGLIANTDVQIAQATRDSSEAAVIAARRAVSSAGEALRAITGQKYGILASPRNDMPLLTPDPASEDVWVTAALRQNANLNAARLAEDIAHDAYLSAFGGHLPNITLGAQRNWAIGGTGNAAAANSLLVTPVNTTDITWTAGVTVPLFTAGFTQSRVRAAKFAWDAQRANSERTLRSTEQAARDGYQGVVSQIAQVNSLRQAVVSSRASLQAVEAGYEVGTKTALDVLTARQQLVSAETGYASAKYDYLNNIVALRLAAGQLDVETVKMINGWLSENPANATIVTPATAPNALPATAPASATAPAAPTTTTPTAPAAPRPPNAQ
jgi:outer membrane protein